MTEFVALGGGGEHGGIWGNGGEGNGKSFDRGGLGSQERTREGKKGSGGGVNFKRTVRGGEESRVGLDDQVISCVRRENLLLKNQKKWRKSRGERKKVSAAKNRKNG